MLEDILSEGYILTNPVDKEIRENCGPQKE